MTQVQGAFQESIRDFFQQFAYLDLLVRPGPAQPEEHWLQCARVTCDQGADAVTVLLTTAALQQIAEGFSGMDADQSESAPPPGDLVLEMANILAGQLYELTHAGRKPMAIGLPSPLSAAEAAAVWRAAAPVQRFLLTDEGRVLGGLVIEYIEGWSTEWH